MEENNQKQICYSSQEMKKVCFRRKIDSIQSHVNDIMEFLTEIYNSGIGDISVCMRQTPRNAIVTLPGFPDISEYPLIKIYQECFQHKTKTHLHFSISKVLS